MKKVILLTLLISVSLFGTTKLSDSQKKTLETIYFVANKIGDYPSTLAAICFVESSAGRNIVGDWKENAGISLLEASLGCMQIRLETCRWIINVTPALKKYRKYRDQTLAGMLLSNQKFSATIASHYFQRLINSRKSYYSAVSGYNGGYYNKFYYDKVVEAKKIIAQLKVDGLFLK